MAMDITITERTHLDLERMQTFGMWRVWHEIRLGTHGQHRYGIEHVVDGPRSDERLLAGPDPMQLARCRDNAQCAFKRIRPLRRARVPIVFHVKLTTDE